MIKPFSILLSLATAGLLVVLGLQALRAPASAQEELPYDRVVVQAYYSDRAMVAQLAAWKEPWEVDETGNFIVVDVNGAEYRRLVAAGFQVVLDPGLTEAINTPPKMAPGQVAGIPGFPCYRTVEETFAGAENIVTAHPNLATWIDIGDSWEKASLGGGYDLMVLRLTNKDVPGPKPKLFIMTSIHPREYATAELNTRLAEFLVGNYDLDPDVTWVLDHHEVHLLLVANPDGRKQAETGLYWRKNTNQGYCSPTSTRRGADLNRNFSFEWGNWGGSSGAACDETYRGPSAASEPETQAIQAYVASIYPDLRAPDLSAAAPVTATGIFLDVHSYGQLVLWPWGFTDQLAPNSAALQTLGRKLAFFNNYFPEQAIGLYPTDGTTDDFGYGELGLASFTYEIGTQFFQQCDDPENPLQPDHLAENLGSLLYAAKAVRAPYLAPAGPEVRDIAISSSVVAPGGVVTLTATVDDTRYENGNGLEPTQVISAAQVYIDIPGWITTTTPVPLPLSPLDGVFDTEVEQVQVGIDTVGLPFGRHTLFVRGQDAAGNWGVYSAAFFYVADLNPQVFLPFAPFSTAR